MPKAIKYSTTPIDNTYKKGNMVIGVSNVDYGPSLYSAIEPPSGGYTVYENKAVGGPSIRVAADEAELIAITQQISGTTYNNYLECLNYYSTQSDKLVIASKDSYPNIVTDGLVLNLTGKSDASFVDNEPTTNLITTSGLNFSTMSTYGFIARTQVTDTSSPSGYACEMEVTDAAQINNSSRIRFGDATNIPTSGNAFVSVMAKFEGGPSSNITPRVYCGNIWQTLEPLDGGSPYLTSEYRRFGVYAFLGTASSGPNPGFSMTQLNSNVQTGQVTRWHSPQVELQTSATPFVSGSRSQNTTWYDLSGNATNGTLTNGPTFDSNGVIVFDGVDDYSQLNQTITLTDEFTLNLFILPTSTSTKVLLGNNGGDYLQINNNFALGLFSSTQFITLNGYYWDLVNPSMVTVTRNSSNVIQTYKNGISSVTGSLTGDFRIRQIGQRGDSTRFYEGSIYTTQIYNRALSSQEVLQNYYQAPIVTDGLVLALDAGNLVSYENGSTTAYSLTGSLSGSLVNGTGYSSDNGGSWYYDGVDDQINCTTNSITSNALTFTIWIKRFNYGTQGTGLVFNRGGDNLSTTGMNISYPTPSNGLGYHWNNDFNTYTYNPGLAIPLNTWCFCCVSVSPTQAIFQVNENVVVRNYTNGTANTTVGTNLMIGTDKNINRYVNANIAYASMYNRALTQAEITQNFNAQRHRFGI